MFSKHSYSFLELILFTPIGLNERRLSETLKGKTVLITGASYGIGESLAYQLAETGAHLILVARTEAKLIAVSLEIEARGGVATVFPADISKPEQVDALISFLHQLPKGVDIVVNNAGKSIRRSIYDSLDRMHDFIRTNSTNYLGPVQLLLPLIPLLVKNGGQIINISTVSVLLAPAPNWAAYESSKAAFDYWFRCVAPELNANGIKTTTIYLPLVKTRMIEPTAMYRRMPAMSRRHVATIICRAIINKNRKYTPWWLIFGQVASVVFRRPWESISARILRNPKPYAKNP
jgi:short-subunit dehydrogenase